MKTLSNVIFIALLLASGALAQTLRPQGMPGMQMPKTGTQSNQQPSAEASDTQTSPDAKPASGQPISPGAQGMGQMQMEMHSAQDITSNVSAGQEPENPDQKTGSNLPVPDLLQAAKPNPAKTLDDFEALAFKNNPTLKQAQAMVQTAAALARQAALWPNPSVGYQGEQIRGGSFHGGEQGAFVQQDIILGGKLGLRRNVFEQQRKAAETGVDEQNLSVRSAVQIHFYFALTQLRIVEVQRGLLGIAIDAAATAHQLANVGQADAPDVLQAEVEAEQAKVEFVRAQREYIQSYEQLAAVSGDPQMPLALLQGSLEESPAIDPNRYLQELMANSPTLKRAQQEADRAEAELARNKREAVPDLSLRVGAQQNREINDLSLRPVGAQGFATASVQLPIFNRNQGNVDASKAELERQRAEVERIRLLLAQMAQPLLQQYLARREETERYRTQLIPRARRAYELYLQKYRNMAAAYPAVIVSQRTLFQLEESYTRSLGELWITAVRLHNYLLADGLSAPPSVRGAGPQINPPAGSGGVE